MLIGKAISVIAKEKKLSKYRISKESNISQTTLSEIVNEKNTNPTIETLEKIAKGIGISVSVLMKKVEDLEKKKSNKN